MPNRFLSVLIIILLFCLPAYAQENQPNDSDGDSDGLRISGLAAVDDTAIGTLTRYNGGFPVDFWQSLPATETITAIGSLPVRYERPELLSLARSILLTAAPLNRGDPKDGINEDEFFELGREFMMLRIRKLYHMGLYEDADVLLNLVPGRYFNDAFEQLSINLGLELGAYEEVCLAVPEGQNLPPSENNFWHRLILLCSVLEGRNDEAEFILNVMNEVQGFSEGFTTLARQALKLLPQEDLSFGDNDTISFVLRDHILPPAFDAEMGYDIAGLYRLMRSPAVSDADKALIGLRLHRKAAIGLDKLERLYDKIPFYKTRANAKFLTEADYSHAYQALRDETSAKAKLSVIRRLITAGSIAGHLPSVIRQIAPHIDFSAEEKYEDSAEILSVIELYHGNLLAAAGWNNIAKPAKNNDSNRVSLYNLLLLLAEANSYSARTVQLHDIYSPDRILEMPLASLLAANKIIRSRGHSLLDSANWQALLQHHDSETADGVNVLSRLDILHVNYIETRLNERGNALALTEFLRFGDMIAEKDAYSYLHIWQNSGRPKQARQVLVSYFLQNGFGLTDE